MMKIVDNSDYKTEYETKCDWPKDVFVQGGSCGIVLSSGGNYRTAYFEAFPKNPEMFIRGEGKTLEDAEKNAYDKYMRWTSCEHSFEKIDKDGTGKCIHCGYKDRVFETDYKCIECGKHQRYSNILPEYKQSELDCLCKKCSNKKENLKYLSNVSISSMADFKYFLFKCPMDDETVIKLKNKPETLEEFLEILRADTNIFLYEKAIRMMKEADEESKRCSKFWNKIYSYDEIYKHFYEYYMKDFIKK